MLIKEIKAYVAFLRYGRYKPPNDGKNYHDMTPLLMHIRIRDDLRKKSMIARFTNLLWGVWYRFTDIINPKFFKGKLIRLWERKTRGWDNSELWSLDDSFLQWVYPRLKEFKKDLMGRPGTMMYEVPRIKFRFKEEHLNKDPKVKEVIDELIGEYYDEMEQKAWALILDEMTECLRPQDWYIDEDDDKYYARVERGLFLFKKHFFSLWD